MFGMRCQIFPVCRYLYYRIGRRGHRRIRYRALPLTNPSGEFTAIADFFFRIIPGFTHEEYDKISQMYNQYNFWVVFTAGFSPIPYKLITITAGVFNLHFLTFIIASIVSRGLRFFLIAWLIWKFGQPIKHFIDKYFNWLAPGLYRTADRWIFRH